MSMVISCPHTEELSLVLQACMVPGDMVPLQKHDIRIAWLPIVEAACEAEC